MTTKKAEVELVAEEETATPRKMTLTDLRKYEGPIFVENVTPYLITCNDEIDGKTVKVRLAPAGKPGCVDELPKLALAVAGLRNCIYRGDIKVSLDENTDEAIDVVVPPKMAHDNKSRNGMVYTADDGDWDVEQSLALSAEGNKCLACEKKSVLSARQVRDGHPPLCKEHIEDSNKYVGTLVRDSKRAGNGLGEWVFTPKVIIDPTVRTR